MNYRLLAVISVLLLVSSCHGKMTQNQDSESATQQDELSGVNEANQNTQNFETINNQGMADEFNKQAGIEEIEVADRVFFDLDSSSLSDEARKVLDTQVSWLKSDPSISIIVEGHCDERGTREYNIALGEKRAVTVKKYLVKNGVDSSRIKTVSYGKERPAFIGSGEEIWHKNRRSVTLISE